MFYGQFDNVYCMASTTLAATRPIDRYKPSRYSVYVPVHINVHLIAKEH